MADPYITVGKKIEAINQAVATLIKYATSLNSEQILQSSEEVESPSPRFLTLNNPTTIAYWFDEGDLRTNETMGGGRIANEATLVLIIRMFTRRIVQANKNTQAWDAANWSVLFNILNAFHIKNLYSGTPDLPWMNLIANKNQKLSYQPMRILEPAKIGVRAKGGEGDDSWGITDIPIEIKFQLPLTIDQVTGL